MVLGGGFGLYAKSDNLNLNCHHLMLGIGCFVFVVLLFSGCFWVVLGGCFSIVWVVVGWLFLYVGGFGWWCWVACNR